MSGSGGGGSFGGGGMSDFDCNNVYINTTIMSPDPTVLATVSQGDILVVSLRSATGPLVAVTDVGGVLGTIATMELASLIKCISDGNAYKAKITEIIGGKVQILISRQ